VAVAVLAAVLVVAAVWAAVACIAAVVARVAFVFPVAAVRFEDRWEAAPWLAGAVVLQCADP
jgi:hypothetical protein